MNNNRRPTTFNPSVATNYSRRPNDENTLQQQQFNSYNNSTTSKYDPFQSREILRDVTNSTTSNGTSQRNVMMQQGGCSQQQPLKPNNGNTFNSQPKKPSSANNQQYNAKTIVQPNNTSNTYYGQRPVNVPTTVNNQCSQQPITLQQHLPQYSNTSRGFLPQHSSISNLSNGKVGAKIDIQTTRQKIPGQQLREEELFAPGLNEIYNTSQQQCTNQIPRGPPIQRSNIPQMSAARPQINQSNTTNIKNRQTLANNMKNTSDFPSSKRDTRQFDAVRNAEQAIEEEDEDEEMAYSEDEEELTQNGSVPIIPSIGVSYPPISTAVASGYIAPTSVFANPTSTTSIPQSSSYFSHQSSCTFVPEDPSNTSYDSASDSDEPPKEPTNLLPSMQPLYYFREHNSGTSSINASNCNILISPPTTSDDTRSMRSVIFATDVEVDVLANMRTDQWKNKPNPRYMESVQTDISSNMRCILIDWMNEVASMYTLVPETLYLAVNILDRALSKLPVRRNKLQAFGVASLFISSKFCEINPPELNEFIFIADDTYGKEEVLYCERRILNELEFELVTVQPYDFIEKFLEICGVVNNPIVKYLSYYICEMQLQNIEVLVYPPSVIAASAMMISLYLIDFNYWNPELAQCFGFSKQACQGNSSLTPEDEQLVITVNDCLASMFRFYVGMATGRINFSAVRTKYCHMVFQGVGECTRKIDKEPPYIPSIRGNTATSTAPNYHP